MAIALDSCAPLIHIKSAMRITRSLLTRLRLRCLRRAKLAMVRAAANMPFKRGRIAQLKQLCKFLERAEGRMGHPNPEVPANAKTEIHSITFAYAFAADNFNHAINIISRLFGSRRESKELIERIKSFSRHTPALSSGQIGFICRDTRWRRFGDTLVCPDLPSDIEHIHMHYSRATPSYLVISFQCFFREGGSALLKSSIGSANTIGIPSFSIRQLLFGKRFQCSVQYEPYPIRDSLHASFSEVGSNLEQWLISRMAKGVRCATARSIVPAFKVSISITGSPSTEDMNQWSRENREWLRDYGINGWNHLQYTDENSIVNVEQCMNSGWRIYFTLLERENVDAIKEGSADLPFLAKSNTDYSIPLSFFGASFSLLDKCAESFESNWGRDLRLMGRRKLLGRSREKLVTALHAQMEFMRIFSHDIVANKSIICHFCEDLAALKSGSNSQQSLLAALMVGLQSEAASLHSNQKGIVSGVTDAIGLKNVYSSASLQRSANALALLSIVLASLQIIPIACALAGRHPAIRGSWPSRTICPAFGSNAK